MNNCRIEQGNVNMLLFYEHANFRAAQDDTVRAFIFHLFHDAQELNAGFFLNRSEHQFIVDNSMYGLAIVFTG